MLFCNREKVEVILAGFVSADVSKNTVLGVFIDLAVILQFWLGLAIVQAKFILDPLATLLADTSKNVIVGFGMLPQFMMLFMSG